MKLCKPIFVVCLFLSPPIQAEMMQCKVKKNTHIIPHFFDSSDKKARKSCINKPVAFVTSSGKKISSQYTGSGSLYQSKIDKQTTYPVLTNRKCGGSGGTVKANGKIFHLDPAALCKYEKRGKGTIAYGSHHVKLHHVDANFRGKIARFVNQTAAKYGVEPEFVHAIISAESAYRPNATSHAGAMGLMQLMPFTARRFGVANAYNPQQNIEAGTRYLKLLYDEFGSLELAAAGYNAGEGAVRRYNSSIPPFKETRAYVPRVMAYYRRYKKNRSLILPR